MTNMPESGKAVRTRMTVMTKTDWARRRGEGGMTVMTVREGGKWGGERDD